MTKAWTRIGALAALVLLFAAPLSAAQAPTAPLAAANNAFDRYIARKDPNYGWSLNSTIHGAGYTGYVLKMTSQAWRSASEVDHPIWTHWVIITVPDHVVTTKTAFLYSDGGSITDPAPTKVSDRNIKIATDTNTIAVELRGVPNEPLKFSDNPTRARSEDDLIAYAMTRQIATGDEDWMVRFAMTKAGVAAMDATQEFMKSEAGGHRKVDKFVVSGGSKRGWTAWMVALMDKRVSGVIPIVIDMLNNEAMVRHHYQVLGFFSPALGDYVNHNIFPHLIGTPELRKVQAIEDPYSYRNRARMRDVPKYILNAAGDQYFLPDNSQFYYKDLPGSKAMRYVPNAKHDMAGTDVGDSMVAYYQMILAGKHAPRYSWVKSADGTLTVRPRDKPVAANLWQATNPNARDFRVDIIGKAYTSSPMAPQPDGSYVAQISKPATGYTAFFVELVYDIGAKYPLKVTSEVSVVPDVEAFHFENAAAQYPVKTPR